MATLPLLLETLGFEAREISAQIVLNDQGMTYTTIITKKLRASFVKDLQEYPDNV